MTRRKLVTPRSRLHNLVHFQRSFWRVCATLVVVLAGAPVLAAQVDARPWGSPTTWQECTAGVLFLGYSDRIDKDTFDGTNVGGLSALAHDQERGTYYALVDNEEGAPARFYTMHMAKPSNGRIHGPKLLDVTTLTNQSRRAHTAATFDGEGMAVTPHGTLLVSSETKPSIIEFTVNGSQIQELPIPQHFLVTPDGDAQVNESLEGLTLAPDGETLYAANESPLLVDGSGQNRILRYDYRRFRQSTVSGEFYYQTDEGLSIGEILAFSETELLVLERTYLPDVGNTIRIYLTSTVGATDVSNVASLENAGISPLPKELLVDIVDCPPGDASVNQPQPNPLLDNFEGMAFGPLVNGEYRTLYLLSDDNFNPAQVTRMIGLGIDQDLLNPE